MLQANNLHKSYGGRAAVSGISLGVARGQIIGLLGPNGAGKSTTVSMLCGLTKPDQGSVTLNGLPIEGDDCPAKHRLGLVPQDIALYEQLSAQRNLETFGALYGLSGSALKARAQAVLEQVGLADRAHDKPDTFSGGMKRRLNIACALMHDPDTLLLDEPTVGIDPQSRNAIFDHLESLKASGKALIYTTHYMEEAERLCDRIIIIDHGKVIANDTLAGLYRLLPAAQSLAIEVEGNVDTQALVRATGVKEAHQSQTTLHVSIDDLTRGTASVSAWLSAQGHRITHLSSGRATLETLFLNLTGRQLRD
ncbi:MAG: ABC transporter ATP-binding protein [Betaproteobacteria bacterium]|nr:ABC transporter ATP-binding protein [Betaproteobacteria bacterium]